MKRLLGQLRFLKSDRLVMSWAVGLAFCCALFVYLEDRQPLEVAVGETDSAAVRGSSAAVRDDSRDGVRKPVLHPFDLNTATAGELAALGFAPRQIASVMKYRGKGGVYRRPEQMSRIYGMTKGQYDALLPFFTVGDDYLPASRFVSVPSPGSVRDSLRRYPERLRREDTVRRYPEKLRRGETVPLNAADTSALQRVPGIGAKRARQIAGYRERLGGFHSLAQLSDLEFLSAETHQYFTLDAVKLRKIRINHLPFGRLLSHPYISYSQAKAICDYRRLHGPIKSLEQLSLDSSFPEQAIRRLEPYVDFQ